ncbi:hypothetical protein LT493_23965 [Streptomyces tricolor]|nr:hypothetical protein [Streptomyces tricolor]
MGENVADRTRAAGLDHRARGERAARRRVARTGPACPARHCSRPVIAQADARRLPGLAQAVQGPLDAPAVLARRDEYTSHWKDDGQVGWLKRHPAPTSTAATGAWPGPASVTVTAPDGTVTTLTARHAVAVCTGTRAQLPDLPGLSPTSSRGPAARPPALRRHPAG